MIPNISPLWLLVGAGIVLLPFLWENRSVVINPLRKLLKRSPVVPTVITPMDDRSERHAALCLWRDFSTTMPDEDQQGEVIEAIEILAMYSTEKA